MKMYSKIALLVAVAIMISMAACNRAASTAPVVTPTSGAGEVPFPVDPTPTTGSIADFGTQTAVAQEPQAETTPQVVVNTPTADEGGEQGGGQDQTAGEGQEPAQPAAPTTAAPVVNTPVVERPSTYTLQRGEWPICIARRFDLDLSSFFALNGLNMNSQPAAGTTLQIPSTGSWSSNYGPRSLRAHPTDYTVATGDTVYTVACQFGDVTPQAIQAVNNLGDTTNLTAGTTIRIP